MKFTGSVQQPITHLLCEFDENRTKLLKCFLLGIFLSSSMLYRLFYQASPLIFSPEILIRITNLEDINTSSKKKYYFGLPGQKKNHVICPVCDAFHYALGHYLLLLSMW